MRMVMAIHQIGEVPIFQLLEFLFQSSFRLAECVCTFFFYSQSDLCLSLIVILKMQMNLKRKRNRWLELLT